MINHDGLLANYLYIVAMLYECVMNVNNFALRGMMNMLNHIIDDGIRSLMMVMIKLIIYGG